METVYNSLRRVPMMQPLSLYMELQRVHIDLITTPSCRSVQNAIGFMYHRKNEILRVFGECAWSYACAPSSQFAPELTWGECVARVEEQLQAVQANCQSGLVGSWREALRQWTAFVLAVSKGCGNGQGRPPKYVIRQTPHYNPFFGQRICIPTLTPDLITERNYASIGECKMALAQLHSAPVTQPAQQPYGPTQNYYAQVFCNKYGCFTQPQWSTYV